MDERDWIQKRADKKRATKMYSWLFIIGFLIIGSGTLFIPGWQWKLICFGIWMMSFSLLCIWAIGIAKMEDKKSEEKSHKIHIGG
jgi:hypothetical protein